MYGNYKKKITHTSEINTQFRKLAFTNVQIAWANVGTRGTVSSTNAHVAGKNNPILTKGEEVAYAHNIFRLIKRDLSNSNMSYPPIYVTCNENSYKTKHYVCTYFPILCIV